MLSMLLALLAFAISASGLGNVDLGRMKLASGKSVSRFKERRLRDFCEALYPSNSLTTALKCTIGIEDIGLFEPVGKISRINYSSKEYESRIESNRRTSTEYSRDKLTILKLFGGSIIREEKVDVVNRSD